MKYNMFAAFRSNSYYLLYKINKYISIFNNPFKISLFLV